MLVAHGIWAVAPEAFQKWGAQIPGQFGQRISSKI